MAENISSQYTNLFGARPAQNNLAAYNATPAATVPVMSADQVQLSAPRPDMNVAVPTATPNADMRAELLALQGEMQRINRQIESMIQRLDQQPVSVASAPAANSYPTLPALPPANNAPVTTAALPTSHTVGSGDYLWKIAKEQLGDANRWPEIYELNKDTIGDNPNLLYPGQVLKMPGAPGRPSVAELPQQNATWPPAQPTYPQTPNYPPLNNQPPQSAPPTNNYPQPPMLPPQNNVPTAIPTIPSAPPTNYPQPAPPQLPTYPAQNQVQNPQGVVDVPPGATTNRQLTDQDAQRLAAEFGLAPPQAPVTPQLKANVNAFLDEMESYRGSQRGKVFGPGMEALAANPSEVQQIRNSVAQIQQALDLLIKNGRLRVTLPNGQPVQSLNLTGSFFKVDAQGKEILGANGQPQSDEAFIAAITQFKANQGIHQNYLLGDNTWAINEMVGPATVEALKARLLEMQQGR